MRSEITLLTLGLSFSALWNSTSLIADEIPKLGSGEAIHFDAEFSDVRYQIGDEWGKKPVTNAALLQVEHLARIAQGTVNIRGATGFYLGEFAGEHVFATNHHVCPSARACTGQNLSFRMLGVVARIDDFLGTWSEVDLSLLTARVSSRDLEKLSSVSNPFRFDAEIFAGQKLITVGFGSANNPRRQLVANWDEDCIVFSQEGDYRFMHDPDQYNQGSYRTWSFANGCDVSHGDSGSAIVDRDTGGVIGLIWTGKIPKKSEVRNSQIIQSWIDHSSEQIWQELSYAVPVHKIGEVFDQSIVDESLPLRTRNLLSLLREVR
ncbi:MAG: S1 family peptidase [Oligoflexus sp.]